MPVMSEITLLLHSGDNHLLFLLESNGSCGKRKFKGLNWQHMLSDASEAGFAIPPCT